MSQENNPEEKKQWETPELTELDILEDTQTNFGGAGPDGGTAFSSLS